MMDLFYDEVPGDLYEYPTEVGDWNARFQDVDNGYAESASANNWADDIYRRELRRRNGYGFQIRYEWGGPAALKYIVLDALSLINE